MTSEHGQAPIYKLHSDVLHEIFKINTITEFPSITNDSVGWPKEPEHLPLTVAYTTSHVCKQWRDIILQSPIIWGRCIDFYVMEGWNPSLKSLVFERAKESFLSITASRHSVRDPFFLEILTHHWDRIQQLDIDFFQRDFENVSLMELLCRPAPSMSFCRIASSQPITSIQRSVNLLSNQAPSLVFLWCPAVFVPKTPRNTLHVPFSKVCYLSLYGVQMTARNLLETCLEMPFLEVFWLGITFDQDGTTKDKLPQPYLPRLNQLSITTSSFDVYSLFMDQIILANGCSVRTRHMVQGVDQISDEELDNMQSTLLRYSQSFLDSHQECTNISLRVTGDRHIFKCDDGNFAIKILRIPDHFPYHLPAKLHFRLIDNICSLKFPARTRAIKNLYLTNLFYYAGPLSVNVYEIQNFWPPLIEVLDSMEWVSHITLTHGDDQYTGPHTWMVLNYCLDRCPSFTSLTILEIPSYTSLGGETSKSALVARHKRIPFQLITLSFVGAISHVVDLRFMNDMLGLTVAWTVASHTVYHKCGVDDPEQLYISIDPYSYRRYRPYPYTRYC